MYAQFLVDRGNPFSCYQRALLSNAATSALRLHQRLPSFQLSRAFFSLVLLEDSAHYLFYSLMFVSGHPITSILTFSVIMLCFKYKNDDAIIFLKL